LNNFVAKLLAVSLSSNNLLVLYAGESYVDTTRWQKPTSPDRFAAIAGLGKVKHRMQQASGQWAFQGKACDILHLIHTNQGTKRGASGR
jgi:hypothetical protein